MVWETKQAKEKRIKDEQEREQWESHHINRYGNEVSSIKQSASIINENIDSTGEIQLAMGEDADNTVSTGYIQNLSSNVVEVRLTGSTFKSGYANIRIQSKQLINFQSLFLEKLVIPANQFNDGKTIDIVASVITYAIPSDVEIFPVISGSN